MKAIKLCNGFGIENLQLTEKQKTQPAKGQVLVKIEAVALNYVDLLLWGRQASQKEDWIRETALIPLR